MTVLRSSVAYGAGDKPKFSRHFTQSALNGQDLYAHRLPNGYPKLDLLRVDNIHMDTKRARRAAAGPIG